ncbi:MAG TPA: aldehyde dehydrogenase family protein, partial [Solirubrobacterales bacterium]|nr:aldehyde dehydrogenase family protein [Solirubrobacterales bacterium]
TAIPFKDEAEALVLANDVQYGLTGYLWTADITRAFRFTDHLDAGMIWVNSENVRHLPTPFGGVKNSGIGRDGGDWSFDFYMETKNIAFATLSDIEHDIELMLFNLEDSEKQQLVQMDEVVMVRGTVDQSEEGSKLKVRDAELFNPSEAQIEKAKIAYAKKIEPFVVRVVPEQMSLDTLEDMKSVFGQHQGESDVVVVVEGDREHRLKLGPDFRVRHSPGLATEIDQIFGDGTAARAA